MVSAMPSFRFWGRAYYGTWVIYTDDPGAEPRTRAHGRTKDFKTIKEAHAVAKAASEDVLRRPESDEHVPWPDDRRMRFWCR